MFILNKSHSLRKIVIPQITEADILNKYRPFGRRSRVT